MFAPLYPHLYRVLAPMFPDCLWSAEPEQPLVCLSFDDGPHPQYTPQLLEVLEHLGVTANFFWLGAAVRRYPDVAREVFRRGHWLGLHGDTHRAFPQMRPEALQASLSATQAAIANACDRPLDWVQTHVRDVRPPQWSLYPQNPTVTPLLAISSRHVECGARRLALSRSSTSVRSHHETSRTRFPDCSP